MIVFSTFSVVSAESNFAFYVRKGLLFFSMLLAKNLRACHPQTWYYSFRGCYTKYHSY